MYIYIYGTEVENGPCIYIKIRFVIKLFHIVKILFEYKQQIRSVFSIFSVYNI